MCTERPDVSAVIQLDISGKEQLRILVLRTARSSNSEEGPSRRYIDLRRVFERFEDVRHPIEEIC